MTYLGVFIAVLAAITVAAYLLDWNWTGMVAAPEDATSSNKTLWDWLGLLIVPAVLAAGAFGINSAQTDRDRKRRAYVWPSRISSPRRGGAKTLCAPTCSRCRASSPTLASPRTIASRGSPRA